MIITRQKNIPWSWVGLAYLPWAAFLFSSAANTIIFTLEIRKFTANPVAISTLLTVTGFMTMFTGPLVNWLSDRLWTRWGRRKIFYVPAVFTQATLILFVPFAPSLFWLAVIYCLQFFALSVKAPNEALGQEIIPNHQRGRAAVFNKVYVQFGLMAYNLALIGRFDDIFPGSPVRTFFNDVTGEMLIFIVFSIALLSVVLLIGLGVKEIRPKYMQDMKTDLGGKVTLWRIVKKLFLDVFSAEWWPLYLLAISQVMYGVKLGGMVALMYTDQWEYSTQVLGFTQGFAQLVSIFVIMLVFPIADKFDKLKFYLVCVWLGLLGKMFWYAYVMILVPDNRPSVMEILIIGEGINIIGQLAGIISYPLVYEFIPLNKLGTASAGLSLFRGFLGMVMGPLVGFWLLLYSNIFMPGAGSSVVMILEKPIAETRMELMAEDWEEKTGQRIWADIHKPYGMKVDESRQWTVRIRDEEAESLAREIEGVNLKLRDVQSRLDDATRFEVQSQISDIRLEKEVVQEELAVFENLQQDRAMKFLSFIEDTLGDQLETIASGLLEMKVDGRTVLLKGHIVYPIEEKEAADLAEQLSLKLNWGFDAVDISVDADDPTILYVTGTVPEALEEETHITEEVSIRIDELAADQNLSEEILVGAGVLAEATKEVIAGTRNNLVMSFPGMGYKPQKVDYFSSYLLMGITDIFAILIVMWLIRAEKAGKIQRRGKLEEEASAAQDASPEKST